MEDTPGVFTDDAAGGRLATQHLLDLGHERIAFVGDTENGPFGFTSSEARRNGYEAALHDAGIEPRPELVRRGPHRRDAARAATAELLALNVPPTAVRSTTAPAAGRSTNTAESRPMRRRVLNGMMRGPKQFEGER